MATLVIGLILCLIVGAAIRKVYNDHKHGGGCGCGCADCPSKNKCH